MRVVILGGGLAGISTALNVKVRLPSSDVIVIEGAEKCLRGGLLMSVNRNGFIFDAGGSHVIFSKDANLLKHILDVLGNNVVRHVRRSYVLVDSVFVPYPFEVGLYALPPEERAEAVISFLEALMSKNSDWRPKNLEEWIYGFFGKWIGDRYLAPYNEKVWKRPLSHIDVDWIYFPGRLPIPDWRDVVKSAIGLKTTGYHEQQVFYYPYEGGIQALYDSFLNRAIGVGVHIVWGESVTDVRRIGDGWLINGRWYGDVVINTIPLPKLVKAMEAPEHIIRSAEKLDFNSLIVVGVALRRVAPNHHWIYVPNRDIIFHRYAWISNYSPRNAPKDMSALIAEVTVPRGQPVDLNRVKDDVVKGLERLGIAEEKDILFTEAWLTHYAYPVHTLETTKARMDVLNWLREVGVLTTGRWGKWMYWNMDKVIEDSLKLSTTIL